MTKKKPEPIGAMVERVREFTNGLGILAYKGFTRPWRAYMKELREIVSAKLREIWKETEETKENV